MMQSIIHLGVKYQVVTPYTSFLVVEDNDLVIGTHGRSFWVMEDIGILRTNGTNSVLIQNQRHHVSFQRCRLGNVLSPNTSSDDNLSF